MKVVTTPEMVVEVVAEAHHLSVVIAQQLVAVAVIPTTPMKVVVVVKQRVEILTYLLAMVVCNTVHLTNMLQVHHSGTMQVQTTITLMMVLLILMVSGDLAAVMVTIRRMVTHITTPLVAAVV